MVCKRSGYYVDTAVQGAMVKRVILHWLILFALIGIALFASEYFLGDAQLSLMQHAGVLITRYSFFFLLMLAVLPTFVYDTVKLSHRFAGPVVRLKDSLKKLADGQAVAPLKFRENDFWRELSEDFNRAADRVRQPAEPASPVEEREVAV